MEPRPKISDLGTLEGPVLCFGGPYSNLAATEALLQRAESLPKSNVICGGDLVAYCGQAAETVDVLRRHGGPILAGNCEKQLAAGALDCGCGFEAGTTCDLLSAGWFAHTNSAIGPATRDWMAGLPDIITFRQGAVKSAVIHGGVTDISRFLWSTSPEAAFRQEIAALEDLVGSVDHIIAGHCGIGFEREIDGRRWINMGTIGMPAHDGTPDGHYVTLHPTPEFHRLAYDWRASQLAMQKVGLTQGYERALETGYWPSEEVLPPELRMRPELGRESELAPPPPAAGAPSAKG